MYLTARQLDQILRDTGAANLPFGARLTPAAQDLLRLRKLSVQYVDPEMAKPRQLVAPSANPGGAAAMLWWAGTPSGTAKAALTMVARESNLQPLAVLEDGTRALSAVRALARAVTDGSAAGGILVVEHSGSAVVLANKAPSLRAVVATTLMAIEAAVREVSANVLVIEPAAHSMMSLRNAILRFVRAPRSGNAELDREMAQLAGGAA